MQVEKDPKVYVADSGKHVLDQMIPCFMADASQRLKAPSFMILCQEMAMNSAEILGFGYDNMIRDNFAWVLSRMQFRFLKPVKWRDLVQMQTWHKGVQGLFFVRDYQMVDAQTEEVLAVGTSSWVVFDLATRTMVRMSDVPSVVSAEPQLTDNAIETTAPKVMIPRKVVPEHVRDHVVHISDIDTNGHTNNVKYVEWALDCVDPEIVTDRDIKEVTVNFNKETHFGDTVSILRHVSDEEGVYTAIIEGQVDGVQSFCVKIVF